MARVVLSHTQTSATLPKLVTGNISTAFFALGNMSALFYGHGNMSRNRNLSEPIESIILRLNISSFRHLFMYHVNIHIIRHRA